MAWGWFRRGRGGWAGPWPGRGPFSYLPPWQRPGWWFGRGACWWLFAPHMWSQYRYLGFYGSYTGYGAYRSYPFAMQQYWYPYLWW